MPTDTVLLIRAELAKLLRLKGVWTLILASVALACWIQWR